MDILFPDINISELREYKSPTSQETLKFLRQTKGELSNELREFIGFKSNPDYTVIYKGPLTVAQQWEIVSEISDNNLTDIIYKKNEISVKTLRMEKLESLPKYDFEYIYRPRYK